VFEDQIDFIKASVMGGENVCILTLHAFEIGLYAGFLLILFTVSALFQII